MKIELPRYSVLRASGGERQGYDFICVDLPDDGDEPGETAVAMFSARKQAQRFINANELTRWVPAFTGYEVLREWLLECVQNDHAHSVVIDCHRDRPLQAVRSFRISDAIDAIDGGELESGDPIFVEGQSLLV